MKIIITLLITLFAVNLYSDTGSVTIKSIPGSVDEFVELRDSIANTPEGGAAMFAVAMLIYNENKKLALDCFTASFVNQSSLLKDDPNGYKGKSPASSPIYLIKQLDRSIFTARSYIAGTSPDNSYKLPSLPYKFSFMRNKYSVINDETVRVFIYSSGAATPRPVTMKINNKGIWKIAEFSSLVVGVRAPVEVIDDDL